jgi:hypothetical protein
MRDDETHFPMLALMRRYGIPVSQARYIFLSYMGRPTQNWGYEDEEQLPPSLQDWTCFARPRRKRRRRW